MVFKNMIVYITRNLHWYIARSSVSSLKLDVCCNRVARTYISYFNFIERIDQHLIGSFMFDRHQAYVIHDCFYININYLTGFSPERN